MFELKSYQKPKEQKHRKYKVCFYSNSPAMATGYAKVLREVCSRLAKDPKYDVHVIAENYKGPPQPFMGFQIWGIGNSTDHNKQDTFFRGFMETAQQIQPDIVIVLEDTFTLAGQGWYKWVEMKKLCPLVMYLPLDGKWVPNVGIPILRMVDKIVSMAKYTQEAALIDGFKSDVIYHGVDLFMFKPVTDDQKKMLRRKYGIPEDCFLIFNYGRNNMRKANPRLLYVLAEYLKGKDPKKYKAFLHIMNPDVAELNVYDVLTRHIPEEYGYSPLETGHIIMNTRGQDHVKSVADGEVAEYLQMADVVVTASSGEGFGLIMPEAGACGKPVISTDYTTPKELLKDEIGGIGPRGITVPIDATFVSSFGTEHAFVNIKSFKEAIDFIEKNPDKAKEMGTNGRKFAELECNWDYIVEQWKETIKEVCD